MSFGGQGIEKLPAAGIPSPLTLTAIAPRPTSCEHQGTHTRELSESVSSSGGEGDNTLRCVSMGEVFYTLRSLYAGDQF